MPGAAGRCVHAIEPLDRLARAMKDALRRSPKKPRLSWMLQKRKLQFQLLSSFRHDTLSSDELYQQHEQRFLALQQKLLDIRKSLEHYRTKALPEYCAACATLGADVWCVVGVDAVGKGTDPEKFRHAMCAINEAKELKNHYFNADEVLSGALRFLDIHINAMKSAKSQIENRKQAKIVYDSYEFKVARLAERKPTTSKQLERNRVKLQHAKETLQTATFDLYRVFAKYESERNTMLNGELEMVRQIMHGFYSKNADATNFTIAEDVDRAVVDQRTEQIYRQMISKELERERSRTTSAIGEIMAPDTAYPGEGLRVASPTAPTVPALVAAEKQPDPSSISADLAGPTLTRALVNQPHEDLDDELSEKLRTIQLSRPKVPTTRNLKAKTGGNQVEGANEHLRGRSMATPPQYGYGHGANMSAPVFGATSTASSAWNEEIKLWKDTKERRKYEDLSDLFAIIKTTEHLETAYVRDAISPEEYTEACVKLISQFKTAETALRLSGFLSNIETFIAQYRLDCPRAVERLVRIGVPATVMHNTTNRKTDSVNVAQTVQSFITLMDVLKLNIRAVDEVQPLLSEMMASLTMVSGLPPNLEGRDKMDGWLRTLNTMRASDELDDDQARQLSFDIERAYSSFMAFLNKS